MTHSQCKIALITGASNPRDIGTAVCRKLASQGINIFFTYWKAEPVWIEEFKQEITSMGVLCESLEIDLSNAHAAYKILDTVESKLGFPSILVNNAAHSKSDGYLGLDALTLDEHYAVNMRSTFLLCVEFARRFEKLELDTGRIINMTSGQDLGPMLGELAYAATKGAISAFTKSISQELAPLGITVNAVNPGPTDSTWMTDEIRQILLPKFPMGRIGLPEDVAQIIAFLASDEARWITGQIINSEGGFIRGLENEYAKLYLLKEAVPMVKNHWYYFFGGIWKNNGPFPLKQGYKAHLWSGYDESVKTYKRNLYKTKSSIKECPPT